LFGPQSIGYGDLTGKDIIVTSHEGGKAELMLEHWKSLGAKVTHMSAAEHDRQMVGVQALPFMIAHAFNDMGLTTSELEASQIDGNSPLIAMAKRCQKS
jgi:prephenate dehydrogenase